MPQQLYTGANLSDIPGTAGSQRIVQDRSATAGDAIAAGIQNVGKIADVAGDVYASNRAQTLVNTAVEDIDAARAAAQEQFQAGQPFTNQAPGQVVGNDEWALIQSAVASGTMTQERARLIGSSLLRTRIAEQPLFADKLRRAASSVLGFNITSEPAQAYFASLPTQASLSASRGKTAAEKQMEEAIAITPPGGDVEATYRLLADAKRIALEKQAAVDQLALNGANDSVTFSRLHSANSEIRLRTVMGEIQKQYGETGQVDNQAFMQKIEAMRNQEYLELDSVWSDHTSTGYQAARKAIDESYAALGDLVETVGMDTLNQLDIERTDRAWELLGNELLPTLKFLSKNVGPQATAQAMEFFSTVTDPSRIETIIRSNPALAQYGAILGNPTALKNFSTDAARVYTNVLTGQPIANEDSGLVDLALQQIWSTGGSEGQDTVLATLQEEGLDTKANSLAVQQAPQRTTPEVRRHFQIQYEQDLPQLINSLAQELALSPDITWRIEDNGTITVDQPAPISTGVGGRAMFGDIRATQQQQARYNRIAEFAEKVNVFSKGINTGWGQVVGTTLSTHKASLADSIDRGFISASGNIAFQARADILENNIEAAQEKFSDMQRLNPDLYGGYTFEEFQEATRRASGIQ